MSLRVLIICTGNVCRSPVAAALLRKLMPDRQVSSAGLMALVGRGVAHQARYLAEADGLEVADHKARQLSHQLILEHDLILVMSERQRNAIGERAPEALGKVMLMGHWLDDEKGKEIPDPYRQSDEMYMHVHLKIKEAAEAWAKIL
ncbi:low molecular weight protein-tyrosine-phosphatase [Billgrantia kenyensis]|uniref:protein-tyrosine-phosphatase n=1 Tax=Billgrantia kenyensis TaxID=321266 RepID=A0A7V9W0A2_9GAMM|nr:low molecular weight protein-tyrosine-phosphatase [Halomonas kenyensis]MBA2778685.1 low molecular weight phosphotyrosine protein phosphatase [Halomonas kenyensis]MCG6661747.1 low molecular weight phosphotyrosine protein phosphatase [Halomonas kenyensis]